MGKSRGLFVKNYLERKIQHDGVERGKVRSDLSGHEARKGKKTYADPSTQEGGGVYLLHQYRRARSKGKRERVRTLSVHAWLERGKKGKRGKERDREKKGEKEKRRVDDHRHHGGEKKRKVKREREKKFPPSLT